MTLEYHLVPPAVNLSVDNYHDARVETALIARLRERGLPVKDGPIISVVAAGSAPPCPVCRTTAALWPPRVDRSSCDARPITPAECYRLGDPERRRAGKFGGLEWARGAFRAECWTPPLFGTLERAPALTVLEETRSRMRVRVTAEGLAPLVDLFGFRAPVATRTWLETQARRTQLARIRHEHGKTRPESPMIWGAEAPIGGDPVSQGSDPA